MGFIFISKWQNLTVARFQDYTIKKTAGIDAKIKQSINTQHFNIAIYQSYMSCTAEIFSFLGYYNKVLCIDRLFYCCVLY